MSYKSSIQHLLLLISLFLSTFLYCQTWTQLTSLPSFERERTFSFSIGNDIYVGGGRDDNNTNTSQVWAYHTDTGIWEQKANYPGTPRRNAFSFSIGTDGYMGTGYLTGHLDDCWKYDSVTDTWTQIANFGGPPISFGKGLSDGTNGYVVFGGNDVNNFYSTEIWKYDPSIDTWSLLTQLPGQGRWRAFGGYSNGKIYTGGGAKFLQTTYRDFWEYDIASDTWTNLSIFPTNLTLGCYSFFLDGMLYVGAGSEIIDLGAGSYSNALYRYDPSSNTWGSSSLFPGTARVLSFSEVVNNKAYVGTGRNYASTTFFNDLYSFELMLSSTQEPLPTAITLAPNPTTDIVVIKNQSDTPITQISVYSSVGQIIFDQTNETMISTVNLEEEAPGVYFVRLQYDNKYWIQKIVKQ